MAHTDLMSLLGCKRCNYIQIDRERSKLVSGNAVFSCGGIIIIIFLKWALCSLSRR